MKVEDDDFSPISVEYSEFVRKFITSKPAHSQYKLKDRQRPLHHRLEQSVRSILFEWMAEVCLEFKASPTTYLLACDIVERTSLVVKISTANAQIIGSVGMFIAFKLEETYSLPVSDLTYVANSSFTDEKLLEMEKKVLEAIQFDSWKMVSCHVYTTLYSTGSLEWLASMILVLAYPNLQLQGVEVEHLARVALRIAQISSGYAPSSRCTRNIFTLQQHLYAALAKFDISHRVVKLVISAYGPTSRQPIETLLQFAASKKIEK